MKITLKVTDQNETYEVTTNLFTTVLWERKFKRKASDIQTVGMGYEDLAFLAFVSAKEAGITVPAVFEDYLKRLQDISVVEEESTNHPTPGEVTNDN